MCLTYQSGCVTAVRLDRIESVTVSKSNSVPFDPTGSLVHLVSGRELEVRESPDEVFAAMRKAFSGEGNLGCMPGKRFRRFISGHGCMTPWRKGYSKTKAAKISNAGRKAARKGGRKSRRR